MAKTTKARTKRVESEPMTYDKALRTLDGTFEDWRFEPTARGSAYLGAVLLSLGGLLLGAGTYAFGWIDAGTWHDNAHLLVVAGLVFELGFLFTGTGSPVALRIGDLGIGVEEDGKVRRIGWCDIERVKLSGGVLAVDTADGPLTIALDVHRGAAAKLVEEARSRIPKRVDVEDTKALGPTNGGSRELAEAPQVAGESCRATGEALTFEKDVRMCGRCSALYHRNGVPRTCLGCGVKLKAS